MKGRPKWKQIIPMVASLVTIVAGAVQGAGPIASYFRQMNAWNFLFWLALIVLIVSAILSFRESLNERFSGLENRLDRGLADQREWVNGRLEVAEKAFERDLQQERGSRVSSYEVATNRLSQIDETLDQLRKLPSSLKNLETLLIQEIEERKALNSRIDKLVMRIEGIPDAEEKTS